MGYCLFLYCKQGWRSLEIPLGHTNDVHWAGIIACAARRATKDSESLGQSESQSEFVQIDNLRPDRVAISAATKKIGILEFCRPSDSFPDQLLSAYDRKKSQICNC